MVQTDIAPRFTFAGDGSTTVFALSNLYFGANSEVEVKLYDSSDVETAQTEVTHYTLTGATTGSGTLTMVTAPASGETLVAYRVTPATQDVDLALGGGLNETTTEGTYDKLTRLAQDASNH